MGQPVDVSSNPVLSPGETGTYNYTVAIVSPIVGDVYKVYANITITNHSGPGDTTRTFGPYKGNTTVWPELTLVHNCIHVTDTNGQSWSTCASDLTTWTYTKSFTNPANCGDNPNTATIAYDDDGTGPADSATVAVNCHLCAGGCSLTIGYWKTHAGFGPQPDMVSQFLPITLGTVGGAKSITVDNPTYAKILLSYSFDASNGINKIYGQLLAAKLNFANGASDSSIATLVPQIDAFLATHDAGNWTSLSKSDKVMVNGWVATLDQYNNGVLAGGPSHCLPL